MKLHKKCRIELATSDEKGREAICEPFLSVSDKGAVLVATDGRMLVQIPVAIDEADTQGRVSGDVLKAARKAAKSSDDCFVSLNGVAKIPGGIEMPRNGAASDNDYPNWRQVVPTAPENPLAVFQIDARRLWLLAQAMGCEGVRLIVTAPDKPLLVEPYVSGSYGAVIKPACPDARGLLMPIMPPKERA